MTDDPYLVPGRRCGACTACCKELAIVEDGMKKMPGVKCTHCVAEVGCEIYNDRPGVCESYYCLWRSIPDLPDHWRPDLCGIMIVPAVSPPGYSGPFAVNLVLVGAPDVLTTDEFSFVLAGFIDSGTATQLDIPGEPGMFGYNMLLNPVLAPAISARDLSTVKALIWDAYRSMKAAPTRAITDNDLEEIQPITIA